MGGVQDQICGPDPSSVLVLIDGLLKWYLRKHMHTKVPFLAIFI